MSSCDRSRARPRGAARGPPLSSPRGAKLPDPGQTLGRREAFSAPAVRRWPNHAGRNEPPPPRVPWPRQTCKPWSPPCTAGPSTTVGCACKRRGGRVACEVAEREGQSSALSGRRRHGLREAVFAARSLTSRDMYWAAVDGLALLDGASVGLTRQLIGRISITNTYSWRRTEEAPLGCGLGRQRRAPRHR